MVSLADDQQGFFEVASQREARDHLLPNIGLSARRNERTALLLDYLGAFAQGHRDQGVMLGLRHRW